MGGAGEAVDDRRRMLRIREERFSYLEMPADGPAADVAATLWTMRARTCRTAVEAKLPSSSAEILFNLGPTGRHVVVPDHPRASSTPRAAWVIGPHARVLYMAKELADSDVVGVRLRPDAIPRVLGLPASELRGRVVDLQDLWDGSVERIREALYAAPDARGRAALLAGEVAGRAAGAAAGAASEVRALRRAIESGDGATVGEVARRFGLTHRRLIALFDHAVGLKPKEYQRVRRLMAVLASVRADPRPSWARVALDAGYYDQAHMANDFRCFTGLTPSAYAARRSPVGLGVVRHRVAPADWAEHTTT
jgi:AraC-like DNA-binding protein